MKRSYQQVELLHTFLFISTLIVRILNYLINIIIMVESTCIIIKTTKGEFFKRYDCNT